MSYVAVLLVWATLFLSITHAFILYFPFWLNVIVFPAIGMFSPWAAVVVVSWLLLFSWIILYDMLFAPVSACGVMLSFIVMFTCPLYHFVVLFWVTPVPFATVIVGFSIFPVVV